MADLSLTEAGERGKAHGGVSILLRVLRDGHEQPCSASPQPKQHTSRIRRWPVILAEVIDVSNGNKRRMRKIRKVELQKGSVLSSDGAQKH